MEQHEPGNEKDLAVYRMERAKTDLQSAKLLFDASEFNKDYIRTEVFPKTMGAEDFGGAGDTPRK